MCWQPAILGREKRAATPLVGRELDSVQTALNPATIAAVLDALKKLDHAVYRLERAFVVVALLVMALVVFLDVVHRTFGDPDSRVAQWLETGFLRFGVAAESAATGAGMLAGPALFAGFVGLTYFAMRSVRADARVSAGRAIVMALVVVAAVYAVVAGMLRLIPNGFVWSQPLALILTLWVGFLGASMCCFEGKHLRVEAFGRIVPPRLRPHVNLVSGLVTASFCMFLAILSWRYVAFGYEEWIATDRHGGLFSGIDIPKWVGFAVLPFAFAMMALRFMAQGVGAWRAGPSDPEHVPVGGTQVRS